MEEIGEACYDTCEAKLTVGSVAFCLLLAIVRG